MKSPLRFAAPLALAGLIFALSGCGDQDGAEAAHDSAGEVEAGADTAAADPAATDGGPAVPGIEGLETERDQVSYMIGLDEIGRASGRGRVGSRADGVRVG